MRARAVHVHVALLDVVENAAAGDAVSQRRIARSVPAGSIFGGRQTVIRRIRISLARAGLLIDQSLDPGQNRRSEGRSTRTRPSAWRSGARGPAVRTGTGIAKHKEMAPETVRRKQRNIRQVSYAIARHAYQHLPRRFSPARATAADHPGGGWRPRRTTARSAAA
jgi:hypothetical protein